MIMPVIEEVGANGMNPSPQWKFVISMSYWSKYFGYKEPYNLMFIRLI